MYNIKKMIKSLCRGARVRVEHIYLYIGKKLSYCLRLGLTCCKLVICVVDNAVDNA